MKQRAKNSKTIVKRNKAKVDSLKSMKLTKLQLDGIRKIQNIKIRNESEDIYY